MRADIREQTYCAAKLEMEHNDTYIAFVSRALLDEWTDWSPTVQVKAERHDDGTVELIVRTVA